MISPCILVICIELRWRQLCSDPVAPCLPLPDWSGRRKPFVQGWTHTLEKVAPWSVISGSFAVCISPLNLDTAGNNV